MIFFTARLNLLNLNFKTKEAKDSNTPNSIHFASKSNAQNLTNFLSSLFAASVDVGFAIYSRYSDVVTSEPSVSYVAHLTGALAGLTIGLLVLKNFEQKLCDKLLWWVALGVYAAFTIFAIFFNLNNTITAQKLEEEGESVIKQHLFHNFGV